MAHWPEIGQFQETFPVFLNSAAGQICNQGFAYQRYEVKYPA